MGLAHPRCSASPRHQRTCSKEDGLARSVVDIEELEVLIDELRGDQFCNDVECPVLFILSGDDKKRAPLY